MIKKFRYTSKKNNKISSSSIVSTIIGNVFLISGIIFAVILVLQPQLINGNAQVIKTSYVTIDKCGDGCGDFPMAGGSWCQSKNKYCCPSGMGYSGSKCQTCGKSECYAIGSTRCQNYKDPGGKTNSYWEYCTRVDGFKGCPSVNVYLKSDERIYYGTRYCRK